MKKFGKIVFGLLGTVVIFLIISAYVSGNFYQVSPDVYRSGQLYSYNMPYYIKKNNIKSILNLTLGSANDSDYTNEIALAKQLKVKLVNFKMSAGQYYDYQQTAELVKIMRNIDKPVLIHCYGGADRTSLASALYSFAILNNSVEVAKQQFSTIYGHLPSIRPHVLAMDNSFANYVTKLTR